MDSIAVENIDNMNEWLIPLLESKGMGIEKFSYLCDINKNTIYKYLNGGINTKQSTLDKIYAGALKLRDSES